MGRWLIALAAGAFLVAPGPTLAQGPSPIVALEPIASGLDRPVAVTHAGDGSGRLFITLQGGKVVVHDGRIVLPTAFLDISSLVLCCGERGLLSVAFHPNYAVPGATGENAFL